MQLISFSDGFQLWSERYNLELRDFFDVQDEITLSGNLQTCLAQAIQHMLDEFRIIPL